MALTDAQPTPGTAEYAAWVARQNQDLINYRRAYEAAMRQQGVTVTWSTQEAVSGPFTLIDPGNATLTRDGVSTDVIVSRGRAQQTTPEELARFDIEFGLKFTARTDDLYGGPPGVPTPWFAPNPAQPFTPSVPPVITPAQPPTVTAPATTQPTQAPPTPDAGTVRTITAPGNYSILPFEVGELFTFEQWNYKVKELTGRVGPDPRKYGLKTDVTMPYQFYLDLLKYIADVDAGKNPVKPVDMSVPDPNRPDQRPPQPPPTSPKDDKDITPLLLVGAVVLILIVSR